MMLHCVAGGRAVGGGRGGRDRQTEEKTERERECEGVCEREHCNKMTLCN